MLLRNSLFVCTALLTGCTGTMDALPASPDAATTTPRPDAATPTPTPDAAPTTAANFDRWMKCMTLGDFQAANMTGAWNQVIAEDNQRCETCHENGGDNFIVTRDEQKFFTVISTNKYYALMYFAPQLGDPFEVLANEVAINAVANAEDPHRQHPRFSPEPGLTATRDFAARTQARFDAGQCGM